MVILQIIKYPESILFEKAEKIAKFDKNLTKLAFDMAETMYNAPGVGLAANQIGEKIQIAVMDYTVSKENEPREKNLIIIANPKIIEVKNKIKSQEGCLSLPDLYEEVDRYETIVVEYLDINNKIQKTELTGIASVVFQHEIDHLNGVILINKISKLKVKLYKEEFVKKERQKY